jgi:hypothetical protein
MASQLGPIEINCDAPSYPIVEACRLIGFSNPEDVRWCRLSHLGNERSWWEKLFHPHWLILGERSSEAQQCVCGAHLPALEKHTFLTFTHSRFTYVLGQCLHCHTVFWEEAQDVDDPFLPDDSAFGSSP